MIMQVLRESFDYYLFNSRESLQQQSLDGKYFICSIPGDYSLMVETGSELSGFEEVEVGWRCIRIEGQLLFNEVGIAASITGTLAEAAISVLVISGYKTDYFFVQTACLAGAISCLEQAGHEFTS